VNEQIKDRLVIGILDRDMSEKLQLRADLTLEKAMEMTRQSEMVKSQIKDQSLSHSHVEAVHRDNKGAQAQSQNQYSANNRGRSRGHCNSNGSRHSAGRGQIQNKEKCSKCNLRHNSGRCFTKGKPCRSCHGYYHFAVCCNRPSVHEVRQSDNALFLDVMMMMKHGVSM
jgi:hypothetical protein